VVYFKVMLRKKSHGGTEEESTPGISVEIPTFWSSGTCANLNSLH